MGGMDDRTRARLSRVAREVAADWGVTIGEPLAAGRYSLVAYAGDREVLKIAYDDEAEHEADALELLDGDGVVRLRRRDPARRAILIERAQPGTDAADLSQDQAIAVAVPVAKRIWRRVERGCPFRSIRDLVPRWLDEAGDHELVPIARAVYEKMTIRDDVLVHGDFHHHNLLRHGARWVAIDFKAMAGEPEFDVPTVMWNPIGIRVTKAYVERWIRAFADAGLREERIREWAIVRGTYLGLPLRGRSETDRAQLQVVRALL